MQVGTNKMRCAIIIGTVVVLVVTLFVLLFVFVFRSTDDEGPIVTTNVGRIQGMNSESFGYSMFLGIPYAQVDETNPFGKSIPQPEFNDIYKAVDDSVVCPQKESDGTTFGETFDCLRLNVFVPNNVGINGKIPVMVWVHGGNFNTGSGSRNIFEPQYLVNHGVIVVTFNYRLGPYGFMCLDIPEVAGNQGLKDQQTAFEWIYDNIEAFGGDINKITLFGEDAGATSIDFHLRSEQERFFNNVILMSGSALAGQIVTRISNPTAAIQIAQSLGYAANSVNEALAYLATVEPKALIETTSELGIEFSPCAEQNYDNFDNFITDYPVNLNLSKVQNMPIMLGYNNYEQAASFAKAESFLNTNEFKDKLDILFNFTDDKMVEMEKIVREFYIAEEPISELVEYGLISFDSDIHYYHPTERTIQALLNANVGNVFFYLFSYVGSRNMMRLRNNITVGGAIHSDILGYIFDASELPSPTEDDQIVLHRLTTMWTNFAKYSNPTPTTSNLLPITWTPLSSNTSRYYMNLDLDVSMYQEPFNQRIAFWDLFYHYNKAYERGYREI